MDEQRLAHLVGGEAVHDLDRVIVRAHLDVPGIGPARPGQLGRTTAQAEDEDLRLDRTLGDQRRKAGFARQAGLAMARTCSRVTCMLCASTPCFWTIGISFSSSPRASNPQSQRTTSSAALASSLIGGSVSPAIPA